MPYILIIPLTILIICFVLYFIKIKYDNFVINNSEYLKELNILNSKYKFYNHIDFNQSHTYDNENFFSNISCLDYLTYQLQFSSNKIIDQINKENKNKQMYSEYLKEISSLPEKGKFLSDIAKLKYKKLLSTEKRLIKQNTLKKPSTNFYINITLYCSKINGRIYAKKSRTFYSEDILALTNKLRNRRGTFYNDRDIWDSICRVERGRVSNKMRFSIYKRDGYRCRRCGISHRWGYLEVDHIIPIAKGGKSTYNNLQTLCHNCNVKKGDSLYY